MSFTFPQVFVKFMTAGCGLSVSRATTAVEAYLDEDGWDSVADSLIEGSHHVDFDPLLKDLRK